MVCYAMRRVAIMVCMALSAVGLRAEMPGSEYACQVMTASARVGIVLVQADDRQAASEIASRSQARTFSGEREVATSVVECILLPQERFRDEDVQRLFERSSG